MKKSIINLFGKKSQLLPNEKYNLMNDITKIEQSTNVFFFTWGR